MRHIFLCGASGVGKSTVIRRTLERMGVEPGGFLTYFGPDRGLSGSRLYLRPAWEEPILDEAHTVARFWEGRLRPRPEAFDALGAGALDRSVGWAPLLLMDECGRLERRSDLFRQRVLSCLEGEIPILGVIKPDWAGTWMEGIARHPAVLLLEIHPANRDGMPDRLAEQLAPLLKKSQGRELTRDEGQRGPG